MQPIISNTTFHIHPYLSITFWYDLRVSFLGWESEEQLPSYVHLPHANRSGSRPKSEESWWTFIIKYLDGWTPDPMLYRISPYDLSCLYRCLILSILIYFSIYILVYSTILEFPSVLPTYQNKNGVQVHTKPFGRSSSARPFSESADRHPTNRWPGQVGGANKKRERNFPIATLVEQDFPIMVGRMSC